MKYIRFEYGNEAMEVGSEMSYMFKELDNERDRITEMFHNFMESLGYVFSGPKDKEEEEETEPA